MSKDLNHMSRSELYAATIKALEASSQQMQQLTRFATRQAIEIAKLKARNELNYSPRELEVAMNKIVRQRSEQLTAQANYAATVDPFVLVRMAARKPVEVITHDDGDHDGFIFAG